MLTVNLPPELYARRSTVEHLEGKRRKAGPGRKPSATFAEMEEARKKLRAIHGQGFGWPGIARKLGVGKKSMYKFAAGVQSMALTPARRAVIERFYRAFFPSEIPGNGG